MKILTEDTYFIHNSNSLSCLPQFGYQYLKLNYSSQVTDWPPIGAGRIAAGVQRMPTPAQCEHPQGTSLHWATVISVSCHIWPFLSPRRSLRSSPFYWWGNWGIRGWDTCPETQPARDRCKRKQAHGDSKVSFPSLRWAIIMSFFLLEKDTVWRKCIKIWLRRFNTRLYYCVGTDA